MYFLRKAARNSASFSEVKLLMFLNVCKASPLRESEISCFLILFSYPAVGLEACLEKVFKQLKLLGFPVKGGYKCGEWLWQLGNSMNVVVKICRIAVACQLLKSQLRLVCLDRCSGVLTAKLRLTRRARFLLLAWRRCRGAVGDFFLNSSHHVVGIIWATILFGLAQRNPCISMSIILSWFLVFSTLVSGFLWNGSGVNTNLWVQKKLVKPDEKA